MPLLFLAVEIWLCDFIFKGFEDKSLIIHKDFWLPLSSKGFNFCGVHEVKIDMS